MGKDRSRNDPHKAPCQGCGIRYPGCHTVCLRFAIWREAMDEIKRKKIEENRTSEDLRRVIKHGATTIDRKRRRPKRG